MIEKIQGELDDFFQDHPSLFLIDIKVKGDKVTVLIDGDTGIRLQDCMDAHRFLEQRLESEMETYSMEVSSAGVSHPLIFPRQYLKNIGRKLVVKLLDGSEETGILLGIEEKGIVLKQEKKVAKEKGKGKITRVEEVPVSYADIKESKVLVIF